MNFAVGQRVMITYPNRLFPTLPGHYGHVLDIEPDPCPDPDLNGHTKMLVWVDIIGKVGGNLDLCFTRQWTDARGWPCWSTDLEAAD